MLLQRVLEVDGLAVGQIGYAGDPQPGIGLGNSADIRGNGVYRLVIPIGDARMPSAPPTPTDALRKSFREAVDFSNVIQFLRE